MSDVDQIEDTISGRQCARCRQTFPIAADTDPMELLGWWTCASCTRSLLPALHRSTTAAVTTDPD